MSDKKSWIDYYLPLVNNPEKEKSFLNKYQIFLEMIMKLVKDHDIKHVI